MKPNKCERCGDLDVDLSKVIMRRRIEVEGVVTFEDNEYILCNYCKENY